MVRWGDNIRRLSASTLDTHRYVDRFVAHGAPVSFRELCAEVLSLQTRYLVLDLDGTVHLGRNLGELLGWELTAHQIYGPRAIERLEPHRRSARWLLDWRNPRRLAAYVAQAAKVWGGPGAHYFLWGKVASHSRSLRRVGFRRFHADPIRAVQPRLQTTLMKELRSTPSEILPMSLERIWRRHAGDQVIEFDDIRWIRRKFPRIEIILSSPSPKPVVAFVGERLGIENLHYSTPDRINSGEAKIAALKEAFKNVGDPDVEIVGMSDTSHGEDHCWAHHFMKVADINSPTPFPTIVPLDSPLVEVHSAVILTRHELEQRTSDPCYVDPRRKRGIGQRRRELTHVELSRVNDGLLDRVNALVRGAAQFVNPDEFAYQLSVLKESSRALVA